MECADLNGTLPLADSSQRTRFCGAYGGAAGVRQPASASTD